MPNNNPGDGNNNLNDQERLIAEIQELENDYNELDDRVEAVIEAIREEEEVEGDEIATTELAKVITAWSKLKEKIWGEYEEAKDKTFDTDDRRMDHQLTLERVMKLAKGDDKTLRDINKELTEDHEEFDVAVDIRKDLKAVLQDGKAIEEEWHSADLPPIQSEATGNTSSNQPGDVAASNSSHQPGPANSSTSQPDPHDSDNSTSSQTSSEGSPRRGSLLDDFADPSTEFGDWCAGDD